MGLLRWYKRPQRPYNARLAEFSLRMVKYVGPLGLSVAFFFFLSPSWDDKGQVFKPFLLSLIVAGITIFVPTALLRTLLGLRCVLQEKSFTQIDDDTDDYYKAQYMWSKEMKYHKDHFLYKCLGDKVNPEFLSPEVESVVEIDDLKGTYGAATAQASEADGTPDKVAMKGGRMMEGGTWGASEPGASSPAPTYGTAAPASESVGPSAVRYSVPAAADFPPLPGPAGPPPVPTFLLQPVAPAPVAPVVAAEPATYAPMPYAPAPPVAPTPHRPAAAGTAGTVVWEYERNGHFVPFKHDCQKFIEDSYQKFTSSGGRARINVNTSGKTAGDKITVSFYFDKMTSQVQGSHHVNKLNRRMTE